MAGVTSSPCVLLTEETSCTSRTLCLSPFTVILFSNPLYLFTLFSNTRYPHWATRKEEFVCSDAPNSLWPVISAEERRNTIDLLLRINLVLRSSARNWRNTNKNTSTARQLATFCKHINTLRTGDANLRFYITTAQDGWSKSAFLTRACFPCTLHLTFRHRASSIWEQAFRYPLENAFYIFNQQIYFIIWCLLDRASWI